MLVNNNIIKAWWPKGPTPGNFGDILTPLIIKELYGYNTIWTSRPFNSEALIGIGSILNKAENNTVVWGSGSMRTTDPIKADANYLCVRGRRTRDLITSSGVNCPEIFGDPAMILPQIYNPDLPIKYKYGIFAHYVDTEKVSGWYDHPDVKIINPLNSNPLNVVKQSLQCEYIISSSLHGLILAHAYGIPAVWVKHSDKLGGDGTKFLDHLELVGASTECIDFTSRIEVEDLGKFNYSQPEAYDMEPVINTLRDYIDE